MKLSFSNTILVGLALSSAHGQDCETKLIAFGDSLTDNGNLLGLTEGGLPPAPYFEGRFTNGFVWVEFLADALGLDRPTPRYPAAAGTNYAVAGAATGTAETSTWTPLLTGLALTIPALGVRRQVDDFVADLAAGAHPNLCPDSPVLLWGGSAEMVVLGGAPQYQDMLDNLKGSLHALIDGGLTNLIVLNVPPLFASPAATGPIPSLFVQATLAEDNLTENIAAYNEELLLLLEDKKSHHECVEITHVDTFTIIGTLAGDSQWEEFGTPVLNEEELHLNQQEVIANAGNAFWYDGVHPTATVHEIIAGEFYTVLTADTDFLAPAGCTLGTSTKAPKMGKKGGKSTKAPKKGGKTKKAKAGKKTATPE